jgi:hypothetical protein
MANRVFVYAVAQANAAAAGERLPAPGPRGAVVRWMPARTIGAWVSRLPAFSPTRQDLLDHHRVVEAACAAGPTLPVRLGTSFADEAALAAALDGSAGALIEALGRVAGKRELALALEWLRGDGDGAAAPPPSAQDPPRGDTSAAQGIHGSGRAYMEQRREHWATLDRRRRRAEELLQALRALLGPRERLADVRVAPSAPLALRCAVLVDEAEVARLTGRLRTAAEAWTDVRLRLAGPWAPYSFCPDVVPRRGGGDEGARGGLVA